MRSTLGVETTIAAVERTRRIERLYENGPDEG